VDLPNPTKRSKARNVRSGEIIEEQKDFVHEETTTIGYVSQNGRVVK